jgi:hypothetical protein
MFIEPIWREKNAENLLEKGQLHKYDKKLMRSLIFFSVVFSEEIFGLSVVHFIKKQRITVRIDH